MLCSMCLIVTAQSHCATKWENLTAVLIAMTGGKMRTMTFSCVCLFSCFDVVQTAFEKLAAAIHDLCRKQKLFVAFFQSISTLWVAWHKDFGITLRRMFQSA